MLHADKKNLESGFRVRMLSIREKELMFFVRNCQNMANLAAVIACLAQSGLIFTKYIDFNLCGQGLINMRSKELLCAEFTYPIAVFITMGLCLLCMWVSMLVSLLAPGLALRGPDGSMHECVRMIGEEYEYALAILACALAMFFVSAILWSWASRMLPVAIVLTGILLASARIIWSMTRYTVSSFGIAKDDIVTGQMTSARSPTGHARAHGYARLQEERSPRARRPTPVLDQHHPPPKAARAWWGLRVVEHLDDQLHAPRATSSPDRSARARVQTSVSTSEAAGASSPLVHWLELRSAQQVKAVHRRLLQKRARAEPSSAQRPATPPAAPAPASSSRSSSPLKAATSDRVAPEELIGLRDDEAEELRAFRALHAEQEQQRDEQLAVAPAATPAVEGSAPNNQPLIEDGMHDSR